MIKHRKSGIPILRSFSLDLMMEIFKRLSVKTLIRFLCLSKVWASTIRSRYFMKLFLDVSLTRAKRLVFIYRREYDGFAFSSVDLKSIRESSSSSSSSSTSSPTYHVTIHTQQLTIIAPSVHGLIICYGLASKLVIYNLCTRRSITLPNINDGRVFINQYIGYDPIDNDYKVLGITRGEPRNLTSRRGLAAEIWVLTLGSTQDSWRMIQDTIPPHFPKHGELCINGVLYYIALTETKLRDSAIMSFEVSSEKLQLIKGPCAFHSFPKLTNYEGKLAVVFFQYSSAGIIVFWVLEDASKEQWLKKTFVLPHFLQFDNITFQVFSTTDPDTGEIIFTPRYVHESLPGALYFDLRKNRVRIFEIEGIVGTHIVPTGTTIQYICCNHDSVSCSQVDNLIFL